MTLLPALPLLATALFFSACAREPVSVERAMEICEASVRERTTPSGTVGVTANSAGEVSTSIELIFPVTNADPNKIFRDCVVSRSGYEPDRPYSEIVN